jgi:Cdc6-like AAA superfamily ATPase
LPTQRIKAESLSPNKLFIYSKPKTGKTEAVAQLDNAIILDLEKGTKYIDAVKINIDSLDNLRKVLDQIIAEGKPYKYGIVDTVTKLEDYALILALELYRKTPMGANFKGLNVLHLPNGAG